MDGWVGQGTRQWSISLYIYIYIRLQCTWVWETCPRFLHNSDLAGNWTSHLWYAIVWRSTSKPLSHSYRHVMTVSPMSSIWCTKQLHELTSLRACIFSQTEFDCSDLSVVRTRRHVCVHSVAWAIVRSLCIARASSFDLIWFWFILSLCFVAQSPLQ